MYIFLLMICIHSRALYVLPYEICFISININCPAQEITHLLCQSVQRLFKIYYTLCVKNPTQHVSECCQHNQVCCFLTQLFLHCCFCFRSGLVALFLKMSKRGDS